MNKKRTCLRALTLVEKIRARKQIEDLINDTFEDLEITTGWAS